MLFTAPERDKTIHRLDREVLKNEDFNIFSKTPVTEAILKPNSLSISLVEGWRGEICHVAVTDKNEPVHYKIKNRLMHNWKALELSLRNLEISDFPINNKSYNLVTAGSTFKYLKDATGNKNHTPQRKTVHSRPKNG